MYSRSYTKDEGRIKLPDNYNGTALLSHEDPAPEVIYTEPKRREIKIGVKPEVEIEEDTPEVECLCAKEKDEGEGFLGGILNKIGSLFDLHRFPKLELEDILLIALAAFLFLSKNGDKECALMLIILVFIN